MRSRTIINTALVLVVVYLSAHHLCAHKVTLFAWVENGMIVTESYFADGKMVQNGSISVFDNKETLLVTGRTDSDGMFSFPVPAGDDLTIILDASAGHHASFKLGREELGEHTSPSALQRTKNRKNGVPIIKVFAGIACIFGLMGIAMYVYSRKKR
jgi:nickel transport protein